MSLTGGRRAGVRLRTRSLVLLASGLAVLVVLAANAHLVYVAVVSQPECIPHAKPGTIAAGQLSAAKSAC